MAQSVGAVALDIVMGKNTVSNVAKQAIQDVQKTFNDSSATIGNKASAVGTACKNIGASLAPVSIAAQAVIKGTADAAMSFETAIAQVETIAGDASVKYKGSMMDMSDAIMQLSSDTGIAAEDIALATYGAISAGVDTSKSVEFVATANALAVGGFTDMATSVDVLTTTLNAYGDKAGTAESISDKLITTQNLGKTTVNELASSMGKVIPSASAYGVSIDNLCASYVAMTKGGIATAEATTYMKSMLNELAKSGSTVGQILQEETGQSFGQLMASGMSLADVIDILGQSVGGDSEKFAQLWGSTEAGTGALSILNGGTADFNNILIAMGDSTGAASSAMDKMNDTSAHNMQIAMNDMKNAAIELGGAFAPVLSGLASVVSGVAKAFGSLPSPVQSVIASIIGVIAVISPLLIGIGSLITAIGQIAPIIGVAKSAFAAINAVMLANPIGIVIVAITALVAGFIYLWNNCESFRNFWINLWENIKLVVSTAVQNVKNFLSGIVDFVRNNWQALLTLLVNPFAGAFALLYNNCASFRNFINTFLNNLKTVITSVLTAVKSFVINAVNTIRNTVSNVLSNIKSAVSNGINNVYNTIRNGLNNAVNFIKGLASQAYSWGSDLIDGIARGIKNGISKITGAVKDVANTIKSYLHFSVPDVGPLTDYESWMPDFIQGMAKGIDDNKYRLVDAVQSMAGDMKLTMPMSAPMLKNVGGYNAPVQTDTEGNSRLVNMLTQLVENLQYNTGDITIPIYLGNDLIDERIVSANDRRTLRSGGRA
jgi:TP901 family phage tail tape measure protein